MPAKIDYIGTIKVMNNGLKAEVIEYFNSRNMTVKFEDGTIVTNVRKVHFDAGKVSNKTNEHVNRKVGQINLMSNGLKAEIIEYINANNITVRFEDGSIVYNRRYAHFLSGSISNNSADYSSRKNSCLGETRMMKCGLQATCIEYINAANITVKFEDGEIVKNKHKNAFYDGAILHPKVNKSYYCNNVNKYINVRKQMNCGDFCTIIEYKSSDDITVKFDNGEVIKNRTLNQFNKGAIDSKSSKLKFRSLPQMICYYFIKYYFRDAKMNFRPDWLKNNNTGVNFELDIYIPQLKVAIEYDGFNTLHNEVKNTDNIKYNLIYEAKNIDKIIVIYEAGCIKHKDNDKLVEYYMNIQSIYTDYDNFVKKLIIYIQNILVELGIKDKNLNNIVSFKNLVNNYDTNKIYSYNEIKTNVINRLIKIEN